MNNSIEKKFTFWSLLKYSFPSIVMMIFMSLYSIVDGFFISKFISTDALSALNIIYPVINIIIGIAIMLSTGGSAIVAFQIGKGEYVKAKQNFSLIVVTGIISGIIITIIGIIFIEPIINILGANEVLAPYCREYLKTILIFTPACILQLIFQTFSMTAGKPMLGLILTVLAGGFNAVFDYIFIVPMDMGIQGAALATSIGYLIPTIFGTIYFLNKKNPIHFVKPKFDLEVLKQSCFNGSSEMVTNISSSIITFLFNIIMMKYLGSVGVASITIVLYAQFLMTALYLGFSIGVAPILSYNHGNQNTIQLKNTFKICLIFTIVSSIAVFFTAIIFSSNIVELFSKKGTEVYDITIQGFLLFSFSYLFSGINIFSSSLFTALSNGKISAIISFMRTFVFILLGIIIFPQLMGINGIWIAVPFAELMTAFISLIYLKKYKNDYNYA